MKKNIFSNNYDNSNNNLTNCVLPRGNIDIDDDIDEWCQFPHLQPRAELRRNQRGEIGRQHIKGASGSRFSPL